MARITASKVRVTFWTALLTGLFVWVVLLNPANYSDTSTPRKVSIHNITHSWTRTDSLAFARDQVEAEANKQFTCLQNLWGKESGWQPKALNKVTSQGLKAGGIPQLLGMSPLTPPTEQILRGLNYISYRYTTPCIAWKHWQLKKWY